MENSGKLNFHRAPSETRRRARAHVQRMRSEDDEEILRPRLPRIKLIPTVFRTRLAWFLSLYLSPFLSLFRCDAADTGVDGKLPRFFSDVSLPRDARQSSELVERNSVKAFRLPLSCLPFPEIDQEISSDFLDFNSRVASAASSPRTLENLRARKPRSLTTERPV